MTRCIEQSGLHPGRHAHEQFCSQADCRGCGFCGGSAELLVGVAGVTGLGGGSKREGTQKPVQAQQESTHVVHNVESAEAKAEVDAQAREHEAQAEAQFLKREAQAKEAELTLTPTPTLTLTLTLTPTLTLTLTRQVRDAARVHGYRYGWPCAC